MSLPILRTKRLILRPWKESDLLPFYKLNADPKVMRFYSKTLTQKQSNELARKIQRESKDKKYGFWAVEVPNVADFIGFIGLNYWNLEMDFAPCIDIGWRLASPHWGYGYATEGARESLRYGFEELKFSEILSMATIGNLPSQRVMQRLGMKHNPSENFHHPKLPVDHPFSMRVLYRLSRNDWFAKVSTQSNFNSLSSEQQQLKIRP